MVSTGSTDAAPVEAVIFDWGGTLTPWHVFDLEVTWRAYAEVFDPADATGLARRLHRGETERWQAQHHSAGANGTGALEALFLECGVDVELPRHGEALQAYLAAWDPHTYADPDAVGLLSALRERGIRVGVLSNTMWPRWHHEAVFARDGLLHLLDGAVYSSELPVGKPHADAFRAALASLRVTDPGRAVFVGDRAWDDVHGAQQAGMRAILVPHSVIPHDQHGPVQGHPDAIVDRLGDVLAHVDRWNAGAGRGVR